ncbi:uncharacterized protein LOC123592608 [Leopardus geoffroyi]|uniref:uncharacterized protein LOC123592608 n=1 Tax=Leopardus geoffroyi TaxID=46844 RepID=UPI001E25D676|nr:uncharacterized protein LOC123592608 [Leopardus geoffroyi]
MRAPSHDLSWHGESDVSRVAALGSGVCTTPGIVDQTQPKRGPWASAHPWRGRPRARPCLGFWSETETSPAEARETSVGKGRIVTHRQSENKRDFVGKPCGLMTSRWPSSAFPEDQRPSSWAGSLSVTSEELKREEEAAPPLPLVPDLGERRRGRSPAGGWKRKNRGSSDRSQICSCTIVVPAGIGHVSPPLRRGAVRTHALAGAFRWRCVRALLGQKLPAPLPSPLLQVGPLNSPQNEQDREGLSNHRSLLTNPGEAQLPFQGPEGL